MRVFGRQTLALDELADFEHSVSMYVFSSIGIIGYYLLVGHCLRIAEGVSVLEAILCRIPWVLLLNIVTE
jgi:hypothetical protein